MDIFVTIGFPQLLPDDTRPDRFVTDSGLREPLAGSMPRHVEKPAIPRSTNARCVTTAAAIRESLVRGGRLGKGVRECVVRVCAASRPLRRITGRFGYGTGNVARVHRWRSRIPVPERCWPFSWCVPVLVDLLERRLAAKNATPGCVHPGGSVGSTYRAMAPPGAPPARAALKQIARGLTVAKATIRQTAVRPLHAATPDVVHCLADHGSRNC
jgi:hypothetical protein